MAKAFRRSLPIALGALATTTLGGCYYGDVSGTSYASGGDCVSRYGADYYEYDPYAYDDGYGYDCYDPSDYGGGFVQIGFGGGWYDNYYYPGYGLWMFDSYRNRYPLRGPYLNYWGGRRAWWQHHRDRPDGGNWNRPGRGDGDGRPGRPGGGGWNGRPGDGTNDGRPDRPGGGWGGRPGGGQGDGQHGTRPPRLGTGNGDAGAPPTTTDPGRPDRGPGAGRPQRPPQSDGGYVRPRQPRNLPATEPGEVFSTPERSGGMQRPPRNWSPPTGGTPRGAEAVRPPRPATTGQPGGWRPAPSQQQSVPATPVVRTAPPTYSPPPARSAPEPRPQPSEGRARSDRMNDARPD